ncbi:MAG: DUF2267 domain-containing protein [Chloroflexi bacterium]|nr:DUF2267 domain-containing protein [Chloroflexota bacterium]
MIQTQTNEITQYFDTVQTKGKLLTMVQAERWSTAVLKTLALNLSKGTKRKLAKALPQPLADDFSRIFWLAHFRNTNMPALEFQEYVSRRSGHTDKNFAKKPILAVFSGIKTLISKDVSDTVADDLSPELRDLWQRA